MEQNEWYNEFEHELRLQPWKISWRILFVFLQLFANSQCLDTKIKNIISQHDKQYPTTEYNTININTTTDNNNNNNNNI